MATCLLVLRLCDQRTLGSSRQELPSGQVARPRVTWPFCPPPHALDGVWEQDAGRADWSGSWDHSGVPGTFYVRASLGSGRTS